MSKIFFYRGLSRSYPTPHIRNVLHRIVGGGLGSQTSKSVNNAAFHVTDLSAAEHQVSQWHEKLPWITPHYAIKSNASYELMEYLRSRGVCFDVASLSEMELTTKLGVPPKELVYSNPCKMERDLVAARELGIDLTVVDAESELNKIAALHPKAQVLLRIKSRDENAQVQFSHRFGAANIEWESLLKHSKKLGIEIRGVHFHVGSGIFGSPNQGQVFDKALQDARQLFDLAHEIGFKHMNIVDIGGGFPAEADLTSLAKVLSDKKDLFPNCRWLAEPGRYMSASTQTACVRVELVRHNPRQITINDGTYGTFSCIPYDHAPIPDCTPIDEVGHHIDALPCQVFGPSCDGYDVVSTSLPVPVNIQVGDWLAFAGMGAYTQASRSNFNGIKGSEQVLLQHLSPKPNWTTKQDNDNEEGKQAVELGI